MSCQKNAHFDWVGTGELQYVMKIVDVIWQKPVSTYAISACEALVASVNSDCFNSAKQHNTVRVTRKILRRRPCQNFLPGVLCVTQGHLITYRYVPQGRLSSIDSGHVALYLLQWLLYGYGKENIDLSQLQWYIGQFFHVPRPGRAGFYTWPVL